MKKIILIIAITIWSVMSFAQVERKSGNFQIGAFGGLSMPLGTYQADTGRANNGFTTGIFADKYFSGNNFGLGIDVRMMQHGMRGYDSLLFVNGNIGTAEHNPQRFRHYSAAFGPTYQFAAGRFAFEAFVKGGVMWQEFPNYERILTYETPGAAPTAPPVVSSLVVRQTVNTSDKAWAWMGVGGVRFNYGLTQNLSAFVQADYVTTLGEKFGKKSSNFHIEERDVLLPISESDAIKSPYDHFNDVMVLKSTYTQAFNVSAGLKWIFGRKPKPVVPPVVKQEPVQEVARKEEPKAIQVVVKDEQTGLLLSGVKVSIIKDEESYTSITNANGEAERVPNAEKGNYIIVGEKNGIKTREGSISPTDFERAGSLIYKEILHNDPRFTLIGETIECDTENKLSGINTTLTKQVTNQNMSQVSDVEGKFVYQLDQQADYHVVANQAGRYSQTEVVSTKGLDRSKTLYVSLKLGVCDLDTGVTFALKNIHYDFDKSNIRRDAAYILDNVVNIMKQNPTLHIELSSHTDSPGNDAYNMALSQRRAQAAVDYLVQNGIQRSRLVAKGYGETRLLNHCGNNVECSEELHQENRRTEIKVLKY